MLCRSGCPTACNLPFENGPGTLHGQTPVFHNTRNIVFGFGCALSARYAHKMCIRIMGLFELLEFVIFFSISFFSVFFFFWFKPILNNSNGPKTMFRLLKYRGNWSGRIFRSLMLEHGKQAYYYYY